MSAPAVPGPVAYPFCTPPSVPLGVPPVRTPCLGPRAGQLLDAYFTRSFYKHMLRLPVTYEDLEAVDAEFFKSLV